MDSATIDRINPAWVISLTHARTKDGASLDASKADDRFWIVLALTGTALARIDGRVLAFSAPALFCLNEREGFELIEGKNLDARVLSFHPSIVNSSFDFTNIRAGGESMPLSSSQDLFWFSPFVERDGGRRARLDVGPLTAERVAKIVEAVAGQIEGQPDEGWPCRSRSYLIELLFLLQRVHQAAEASGLPERPEDAAGMEKVILYLYENCGRNVTIGELTSVFNTNRTTIMGKFRKATGTSIKDYLIGIRIRFAASLVRDTMLPLSEIMERVGFSDFSHFSKTFRDRVGCPPSEYRQKTCWMLSMYPDYVD